MRNPGIFLLFLLALTSCSTPKLHNIKEGEILNPSSMGLLTGAIEWRQAGRAFTSSPEFEITRLDGEVKYRHKISGRDFRIALPPGQYYFSELYAGDPEIHMTRGRKIGRFLPWLLVIVPIPLSSWAILLFENAVIVPPPSDVFEILPNQATYIGAITIDIPDPFPFMFHRPQYTVLDEGERAFADLQSRNTGIETLRKQFLFKPEEATGEAFVERD